MAAEFDLSILTPEKSVFTGRVEYVQVPGTEGYLGVLAHHAALVTGMQEGDLTVRQNGKDTVYRVNGGFFEVSKNRATVLADAIEAGSTQ